MKKLLTLTLIAFLSAFATAEDNHIETKLEVLASARGDVPSGMEKLKKLVLPKGAKLTREPKVTATKVEVHIVHFEVDSKKNVPLDIFLAALKEKISRTDLEKTLDEAGYRFATVEEMLATRPKFTTLKDDVAVYGTNVLYGNKTYAFMFQFEYKLGTDILTYTDGARPGMFEADYEWSKTSVNVAVVRKADDPTGGKRK